MSGYRFSDEKRVSGERRIKLPGKPEGISDLDPVTIARELRAKSKLGAREARQKVAEAKTRA